MKKTLFALTLLTLLLCPNPAIASTLSATEGGITVSASVQATIFPAPALIAPTNGSVTSNPQEPFVWQRPGSLPTGVTLDHYDLYIDGALFAQGISNTLSTPTEYYFYTVKREGDVFTIYPKVDLADGYHTWHVNAYSTDNIESGTGIWQFYVDSTAPYIKLTQADKNNLDWDTQDLSTFPPVADRYLYVGSPDPLLKGEVEPGANLQFTLICPTTPGIPCTNVNQTENYPDGTFQYRFYGLVPNQTYTIYLSATDAAGNSTLFPVFYLIYFVGLPGGIVTPTLPPGIPTPSSYPFPGISPYPVPPEVITPPQFQPQPPISPTPPPPKPPTPVSKPINYVPLLFFLLVFGLPLHLALSWFGTDTPVGLFFKFLFILLYPFIGKKTFTTHPFTTVEAYDVGNHLEKISRTVADILGKYAFPEKLPAKIFIKAFHIDRFFKPTIFTGKIFPQLCVFLNLKDLPNRLERLQHFSFSIRLIPLLIGILTSAIALYFIPTYFLVIYLYLSLQALFSEYLYPRFTK